MRRTRILLLAVLVLAGGLFGYAGYRVYKSYQPGELVICGFQPGQRVRVASPEYTWSFNSEIVSEVDAQGKVRFSQLGQGLWYAFDQRDEKGWFASKYIAYRGFYVAGLEKRSYSCSPNSPKWFDERGSR